MARRTAAEAAETRRALIDAARQRFSREGFAAASLESICALAGVTRGAAYHHFGDKRELFEAVYREVLEEYDADIGRAALAAVTATGRIWDGLWAGTERLLERSTDPELTRIMILEAPLALGWARAEEMDLEFSTKQFEGVLQLMIAGGEMAPIDDVPAVARLIVGAYNQACRLIAIAPDQEAAVESNRAALRVIMSRLVDAPHAR